MFFRKKNIFPAKGAGPHVRGLPQILLPALVYIGLYDLLQYACLLALRHFRASGPESVKAFAAARPGACMVIMMFFSMSLSLMAVAGEAVLRLRAFGKRIGEGGVQAGRGRKAAVRLLLTLAAAALCILGNAQIQVMDLYSESVDSMQVVYRELPFFLILLIFAVLTPFAEELVFRGIIYTGLRITFGVLPSILLSAALFGLYHGEPVQGAYAFCMGLVLGLSMELTGDLKIPWILHCAANGLPLCLSYFGVWEVFLRPVWRTGALVLLMASLGLLRVFTGGRKEAGASRD